MQSDTSLSVGLAQDLDWVEWIDAEGTPRSMPATSQLLREEHATNLPIRVGPESQNRLNRHGFYFWQGTGTHVWYESRLEAESLVLLDFEGAVLQIATQPFRLRFRAGSECVRHAPDFFAVHENGDQVVYDVKPSDRMTDRVRAQFDETARVCRDVGWHHVVLHEDEDVWMRNIEFLRGARHARCHPSPDAFEQICEVYASGRPIGEARSMVNRRHPSLAMPAVRHMLWHRYLVADLSSPLGLDTIVTTAASRSAMPRPTAPTGPSGGARCC